MILFNKNDLFSHNNNGDYMKKNICIDRFIFFILFIFYIISIISIKSASMYLSSDLGNLLIKQTIWYLIGLFFIFIIIKFDNKFFYKYSFFIYIVNCILLLGLFFLATPINGSKCWYNLFGFSFQPSEFMKISLILVYSRIIGDFNKKRKIRFKDEIILLLKVLIILIIPSILTFLEPDTGAILIYLIITLFCLFISKIRSRWFVLGFSFILIFSFIFFYFYFYHQDIFINILGNDFFYRMDRIINWKNGSGMQLENSMVAISASGLLGFGFNNTPIYFPEAGTDFIFGVFASNYGFVGSSLFIIFLVLFDIYLINLCNKRINYRDKTLIIGVVGIIFYQQVQNISMTIGLLPITGITLPFISYGGSSLISYMILIGLILNITKEKTRI